MAERTEVRGQYSSRTGAPGGPKSVPNCMHYVISVAGSRAPAKIILAVFSLVVSTPTAKPPNFLAIRY